MNTAGKNHAAGRRPRADRKKPRRRGRWAEKSIAAYFNKAGCRAVTNVQDVREIDVLGICLRGATLRVYIVESKSGRQLIDTPVLSKLRYVVERVRSRKTPLVRVTGSPPRVVEYLPMLVIGPRCSLTPQAEAYAARYGIPVYRYSTSPVFTLRRIL